MKSSQAIDRMRQVIRRQHKALAIEDIYVFWLRRYISALCPSTGARSTGSTSLPSDRARLRQAPRADRFFTLVHLFARGRRAACIYES